MESFQVDLTAQMRAILVDWMIEVAQVQSVAQPLLRKMHTLNLSLAPSLCDTTLVLAANADGCVHAYIQA